MFNVEKISAQCLAFGKVEGFDATLLICLEVEK